MTTALHHNKVALISIWTLFFVTSCREAEKTSTEQTTAPVSTSNVIPEVPALHRLTAKQIDNSLSDLFQNEDLPLVSLPQEIPMAGFSNQAIMRDATPFLVESLQRSLSAAIEVAVDDGSWMTCHPAEGDDAVQCGKEIFTTFLPLAWRRPTTTTEVDWIHTAFSTWYTDVGFDAAMQLSLSVILQSPDFLYLTELGDPNTENNGVRQLSDWEIASRLSYLLWDTMPDDELFAAASSKQLRTPSQVQSQAMRMIRDQKSRPAIIEFHRQWLGASYATEVDPDYTAMSEVVLDSGEKEYFTYILSEGTLQEIIELDEYWGVIKREIMLAYEAEFTLFANHIIFGTGQLDQLLTSRTGFVSERTARFYGVSTEDMPSYNYVYPADAANAFYDNPEITMYQVQLPTEQRAGIFTQGAFLGGHSHPNQPSPVLRGVFLRERLLCLTSPAPPGDIPALGELTPGSWTTNRERFAQHTQDPNCAACHTAIDGVGFPFENYDAVGAWRDRDNGAPVDASGEIVYTDVDGPVSNAVDMLEILADSRQVHDCAVQQLYRYAMHRSPTSVETDTLTQLQDEFWADDGIIPNLFVRLVTSPAFLTIPAQNGGAQ